MKKREGSFSRNLGRHILYAEDLVALYDVYAKAGVSAKLVIETGSGVYEFEKPEELSVSELEGLGVPFGASLHYTSHNPYVALTMTRFETRLYVGENDFIARGVSEKLVERLASCASSR